jgi:hypothetical protein
MTAAEAIEILRKHNTWRRGESVPFCDPKELGIAIDVLCAEAERLLRVAEIANIEDDHGH